MLSHSAVDVDTLADVKQHALRIIEAIHPTAAWERFNLDAGARQLEGGGHHGIIFACQKQDGGCCPDFVSVIAIGARHRLFEREPPRHYGRTVRHEGEKRAERWA